MTPQTSDLTLRRLAIFASFSGQGGVEHMLVNLLGGLVAEGVEVDLLLARRDGPFVDRIPAGVNRIELYSRHTAWCVPELALYLARRRPPALLAVKDRGIRAAVRARRLAHVDTRVVGRLGTNLAASLVSKSRWRAGLRLAPMRRIYQHVDRVIAVSDGVASDTCAVTQLPADRTTVVRNPVVSKALTARAAMPCPHRWPGDGGTPVIVGAGRLTVQKDFKTLIRAFATIREQRDCRLLILGDGPEREALRQLIAALGLDENIELAGFVDNAAAVLSRADLFVLSSRWEGSPNALTEALALSTPVVATDCPSGPAETLDNGRIAPLVPVGDVEALARAMGDTLDAPPSAAALQAAVADYDVATSTRGYLEVLSGSETEKPTD